MHSTLGSFDWHVSRAVVACFGWSSLDSFSSDVRFLQLHLLKSTSHSLSYLSAGHGETRSTHVHVMRQKQRETK